MESNYTKIFTGNSFVAQRIVGELHLIGIEAIIKDEPESARLAGFATTTAGLVDLFVHKDEVAKASEVVDKLS